MTILDDIIREKEKEVARLLAEKTPLPAYSGPVRPSLLASLKSTGCLQVIAEIKRASPSKGAIRTDVDPAEQAVRYEEAGAVCISVLTNGPFFSGSFRDLAAAARAVRIPVLCKDFIIHPVQIDRAKAAGASVILLIAAVLPDADFRALYAYARSLGMEVLTEVHNGPELNRVLTAGAELIGVNNRDLRTFRTDMAVTEQLAAEFPLDGTRVLISESGIAGLEEAQRAAAAGASGILVGEMLMRSGEPGPVIRSLRVQKGAGPA